MPTPTPAYLSAYRADRCAPRIPFFLSLLAVASTVHGQILHGLNRGIDLNNAVNPGACILWNWNGTGDDEMVVADEVRRRLVTMGTDPPALWTLDPVETRATDLDWPVSLLRRDVNSDHNDDLILIDGNRYRIWLFKIRTQPGEVSADIEGVLPTAASAFVRNVAVGDLEQDGHPDLLINEGGTAPWLLFDFATATPSARQLTEASSVKGACIHPWDPGEKPVLVLSGVEEDSNTRIYRVLADRSLSLIDEVPGEGVPADLDGQFPPEFVDFSQKLATGMGTIRAKSGGAWSTALEFPIEGYVYPFVFHPGTVSEAADFNGDGRDEVVFASAGSSEIFGLQSLGTPGQATISPLPSAKGPIRDLSSVKSTNSVKSYLTIFSSTAMQDALGNPISIAGFGSRAWLRRETFSSSSKDYLLGPLRVPHRLAVADFNGDSSPDIGALHTTEGQFSVFEGPVWTNSQSGRPKVSGNFAGDSLVIGDFTGDQVPDVLLPKWRKIGSLKTLRQPGSSPDVSFSSIVDYDFSAWSLTAPEIPDRVLGAADFDQDGDTDTLIFDPLRETMVWAENVEGTGKVIVLHPISLAGRWWTPGDPLGSTGHYEWITQDQILILDADGDGDPDIITLPSALGSALTLHRNQGGTFSLETLADLTYWWDFGSRWPILGHTPLGPPAHLLAGRFIDTASPVQFAIYGRTFDAVGNPGASITVAHGGGGQVQFLQGDSTPDFGSVAVCDFDEDGLDDLITAGTYGNDALGNPSGDTAIRFHRSLGDGAFAEAVVIAYPLGLVSQLIAADFTGDGQVDIVAGSMETGAVELFGHAEIPAYPDYAEWIARFPGIDPALTADPDDDGLSNLLEFARGTPPDSAANSDPQIPPPPALANINVPSDYQIYGNGSATHPRPRLANGESLDVMLEISHNMIEWLSPESWGPGVSHDPEHPQWDTLIWSIPPSDEKCFYRFKVIHRMEE
jgi:hypothetical protein